MTEDERIRIIESVARKFAWRWMRSSRIMDADDFLNEAWLCSLSIGDIEDHLFRVALERKMFDTLRRLKLICETGRESTAHSVHLSGRITVEMADYAASVRSPEREYVIHLDVQSLISCLTPLRRAVIEDWMQGEPGLATMRKCSLSQSRVSAVKKHALGMMAKAAVGQLRRSTAR